MSGSATPRVAPPTRRRPGLAARLVPVLLVVVVTGLVLLVATLAASSGPTQVFEGSGPNPDRISTSEPTPTPTPEADEERRSDTERLLDDNGGPSLTWLGTVVRAALLVLIVGALLYALVVRRRRVRWRRASEVEEADDTDFDVVRAFGAVSSALIEDAEQQDAALREGSPRNGIVAAWLRFEQQAAAAGAPRREWETSSEFTLRFLDSVHADQEATSRLARLYRVARFSDHPVEEEDREAAAAALGEIREALRGTGWAPGRAAGREPR